MIIAHDLHHRPKPRRGDSIQNDEIDTAHCVDLIFWEGTYSHPLRIYTLLPWVFLKGLDKTFSTCAEQYLNTPEFLSTQQTKPKANLALL